MKKRSVLAVMVSVSLAAIVTLSLALSVSGVTAHGGGGDLSLTVNVDGDSFVFVGQDPGNPEDGPGPFSVEGTIVVEGGGSGTFLCWGCVFADGNTNVSQVYNIAGRGAIMTQGQEGVPLAIVGGTGDFSNLRGEAEQVFTGVGFDFEMTFNFVGGRP